MTPSGPRGRTRSEQRRDAVLKAAMELMQEDDLGRPSIDRIAQRSGVSKATIYKWWPNRTAVATDAFLHQMMADAPVPDTGSAAEDFRLTLRGMMGFYASPLGAIYAQLVGESQFYPTARERIRTHQVNVRRAAVRKIWDRGVARGELDPNVDPEVALDLIFGPAMYRMATGHGGLTPADADAIVATAMRALASDPTSRGMCGPRGPVLSSTSTATGDMAQFGPNAPGYVWKSAADVECVELFPGITTQPLWRGTNGAKASITTIAPGAVWGDEDHHSPGPEEVYVVSGVLNDGVNDYPAGTFLHAPAGSWHIPQSTEGCVLFLFYPEG